MRRKDGARDGSGVLISICLAAAALIACGCSSGLDVQHGRDGKRSGGKSLAVPGSAVAAPDAPFDDWEDDFDDGYDDGFAATAAIGAEGGASGGSEDGGLEDDFDDYEDDGY